MNAFTENLIAKIQRENGREVALLYALQLLDTEQYRNYPDILVSKSTGRVRSWMSLCDDTLRQLRAINCGSLYGETFEPISEKELTKYELRPIITDFSEYKDCRLYMKRSKEYYQSLELGSRFVLLKNLEYDGGDIRPKGTVAVFVGFCTRLSFFGHEPIPAFSYESEKKVRYIDPACLEAAD